MTTRNSDTKTRGTRGEAAAAATRTNSSSSSRGFGWTLRAISMATASLVALVLVLGGGCVEVSDGSAACDDTNTRFEECAIENTAGCSDWSECDAACVEASSCEELRAWSGVGNQATGALLACLKSCVTDH